MRHLKVFSAHSFGLDNGKGYRRPRGSLGNAVVRRGSRLFFQFRTLSLLPHDFHNHPFVPLPIKLGIKDPLPRP
jgi:hypothetical protein